MYIYFSSCFILQAVLLIYDITNYSSFENLEEWLKETKKVFANSDRPLPYMMLVANKSNNPNTFIKAGLQ